MDYDDENPGYRSASVTGEPAERVSNQDVDDLPTLKVVRKELEDGLKNIDGIHVFDLKEGDLSIKEQIAARQEAANLVRPVLDRVISVIDEIKLKYK